ncbi:MAG: hypothetical protein ACYSUQ_00915 [Planctomycetota bacterium]|jgi:hypothetical protein
MGHWQVIACILGALIGAVVFLGLVANEVALFERVLEYRKKILAEQEARRQRLEQSAG